MNFDIYPRVCGTIIHGSKVLMVKHKKGKRAFWTLPGGGAKVNERPKEAIVREVKEETGLNVEVSSLLYDITTKDKGKNIAEICYLLIVNDGYPFLGRDPEHREDDQRLVDVKWIPLSKVQQDKQVSLALSALRKRGT